MKLAQTLVLTAERLMIPLSVTAVELIIWFKLLIMTESANAVFWFPKQELLAAALSVIMLYAAARQVLPTT